MAIVNDTSVELLDADFTENEIKEMGISYHDILTSNVPNFNKVKDKSELIDRIINPTSKTRVVLYTSGTTGKPKKISHSLNNLLRSIKVSEIYNKDIWAFAYNPTHFAGLQVFFQAITNGNTMIYIFNADKEIIKRAFEEENISRISATPTFYKSIIPLIKSQVISTKSVTSGGEKFDPNLITYLEKLFPNAKIRNVYASTEAGSLFASQGDYFIISERVKDKIKISMNGELLIHKSLIGESEDLAIHDDYYNTKDIVEYINDNNLRFISRNSDFVNVGGYRVNPIEIEELISNLDIVSDVVVYGRKNSVIGNIIVAEIVKSDSSVIDEDAKKDIIDHLKGKIQSWKEPKIYKFVSKIDRTRTGKKVRKK
jgi:acyl-coenzyme A synthetase/AMP-(fatty) acid ligase